MKITESFVSAYLSGENGLYSKGCLFVRFRDDGVVDLHVYGHRHMQDPTDVQFIDLYNALVAEPIEDFLNKVYIRCKDDSVDLVYTHINDLLMAGKYADCDEVLARANLAKLSSVGMLSFLTITAAAKKYLKNREDFYDRVESRLEIIITPVERVPEILKGLK